MPKVGRSTNGDGSIEKPKKAKRRNKRNVAPNDDDFALEKCQESPESNQSVDLGNPMTSMNSRQSVRSLAEFKTMVDGCRKEIGNSLLEKIRDIAQQATCEEATYLSAATDNLAGQGLSKTTQAGFHPDQQVSQDILSSASKLIEEYETFCEETTLIADSKEPLADWDNEYCQFDSVFSKQRNVMRHWIRAYLDKKSVSSKSSASRGGHLVPEQPVWGNLLESMESKDEGSIEVNWAVAISRAERGVQNLVKNLQD